MVAATGQHKFQEPYTPLPDGFVNVEYNNVNAIKEATTPQTCAVMLEPIQGEGGVNIPDDDYLKGVRAWCNEKGLLLILDEVQTGIGRIGTLFGYEQFGIEPERVRMECISASEANEFVRVVNEMTEQIRALGPLKLGHFEDAKDAAEAEQEAATPA